MTTPWTSHPIVAFDVETTGLEPFAGDRVIEFAAVIIRLDPDRSVISVEPKSWLINPRIPIPKAVVQLTGIQDADVASQPTFDAVAHEIHEILNDCIAVAHNFAFDRAFLTAEFERVGLTWPHPTAEIDTLALSMARHADAKSHKLEDLCKRLGISLVDAHRATNDAEACGRAFVALANQAELTTDIDGLIAWGGGIGRPPPGSVFGFDEAGQLIFLEGELAGEPIAEHQLHLAWMLRALERRPEGWRPRFTDATRRWIERYLAVRASGRLRPTPKTYRPHEWALDPCIGGRGHEVR